jgi:hypothetical protein
MLLMMQKIDWILSNDARGGRETPVPDEKQTIMAVFSIDFYAKC